MNTEALLHALRGVFRDRGAERLPTEAVVAALAERLGRPITAHRLARTLKPLGIEPRQFRLARRRAWGYVLADVSAATAETRDAELSGESQGSAVSGESRDAGVVEPLVSGAAVPSVGSAAVDPLDASREWLWRLALGWGR